MADGEQNHTSQQEAAAAASDEDRKATSQQASPCVIEIHDSPTECEEEASPDQLQVEEKDFVSRLHSFMKKKGTPIERIPHLGFKQINLWRIYKAVSKLGGYDSVTAGRLWKKVYDELGGSPGSTSAATCTRRHYEKLVLPFERHIRGEEDRPLPLSKPRKPYKRNPENKSSKAEEKRKRTHSDRELDSEIYPLASPEVVCMHEAVTSRHFALWAATSGGHHSDCRQVNQPRSDFSPPPNDCALPVPVRSTWVSHIPSAPGEVISPLEKKKRTAQASLNKPPSSQRGDSDRPSVIHCSQSPVRPSSDRHDNCSDGSPLPPSSLSSRSPSPLSVSSDCNSGNESRSLQTSKMLDKGLNKKQDKDRSMTCSGAAAASTGPDGYIGQVGSQTLSSDSMKSQKKDWKTWKTEHNRSSKYLTNPYNPLSSVSASNSSFSKVNSKPVQLLRPAPIRLTYEAHQSMLHHLGESPACARKLNGAEPWPYSTEKRERFRTPMQQISHPQQSLSQSTLDLPAPRVLTSFDKSGGVSRHQPSLYPVLLQHRVRQTLPRPVYPHVPLGPGQSALLGPSAWPYSYPLSLLSPQPRHTLPPMSPVYIHKL